MDTQSECMNCNSGFLIGLTFRICSPIGTISTTLPLYQLIDDSDRAKRRYDIHYLQLGIGRRISIVNGNSLSTGNLIPSRPTNDYSVMLQWFIPSEVRCCQHQSIMTSQDMQSHISDKSITNDWYIRAQLAEWTCINQLLFQPDLLGLRWTGLAIHMSCVARDTLHPIYGNTTQLQNTVYSAPIKHSQIKSSVVCRNH